MTLQCDRSMHSIDLVAMESGFVVALFIPTNDQANVHTKILTKQPIKNKSTINAQFYFFLAA